MALGHGRWTRDARSRLFVPETAGSTPTFNPADFGADFSWWAARLESYANGASVPTWTDRGSGTLTVTGASGQQPTFRDATDPVAPNGKPCVRWVNGNRLLNGVTGVTGPWTAAVVCRPTSINVNPTYLIGGATTLSPSVRFSTLSGGRLVIAAGGSGQVVSGGGYAPTSPAGWQVIVISITSTASNARLLAFKNGLSVGPSPDNYLSFTYTPGGSYNIGAGTFALGSNGYAGEIAEAVLWRSDMSNANKIVIGKQLSDLYGVTY